MGDLNAEDYLIKSIDAKKPRDFVDPFPYTEPKSEEAGDASQRASPAAAGNATGNDPKGATGANATAGNVSGVDTSRQMDKSKTK